MLGRIRWGNGRKVELKTEQILGISLLCIELPQNSRRPAEKVIQKGAELLCRNHITRVLTPSEFPWDILAHAGLRPVETRALRCALTPIWVKTQLKQRGICPEEAVLRLKGAKREFELEQVARSLCPMVRNLIVDMPNGNMAAKRLRQEMGVPVLSGETFAAHLTLLFDGGPVLAGAKAALRHKELPLDCESFPLLEVLWENGRIKTEEIVLEI